MSKVWTVSRPYVGDFIRRDADRAVNYNGCGKFRNNTGATIPSQSGVGVPVVQAAGWLDTDMSTQFWEPIPAASVGALGPGAVTGFLAERNIPELAPGNVSECKVKVFDHGCCGLICEEGFPEEDVLGNAFAPGALRTMAEAMGVKVSGENGNLKFSSRPA